MSNSSTQSSIMKWSFLPPAFYGPAEERRKYATYEAIPSTEDSSRDTRFSTDNETESFVLLKKQSREPERRHGVKLFLAAMSATSLFLFFCLAVVGSAHLTKSPCDTVEKGYTCRPSISHFWGQYSPYFSVPSEISIEVPAQCQITFAQVLSRHGARDPTTGKTASYRALVDRIRSDATSYGKAYAFIEEFEYNLGANGLSVFGQQQMINSGIDFYNRYKKLGGEITPFIRSSGSDRVVESAQNWTQGFHSARVQDRTSNKSDGYPYDIVVINEDTGSNNTLDHGLCTSFEDGFDSTIADSAQAIWASIFASNITARLNFDLPGVNFTTKDTIYMMDLCPFNTVADVLGTISPFCDLFTESEWRSYDYYQSLGKYYGYSWGNPLGATQGVGFTNELIARLTASPVEDHTSTNHTLDDSIITFPVGNTTRLYADFSHDNDMTAIFSALGLYNSTAPLSNVTIETAQQTNGYRAAWSVPFAGRAYFEKMSCAGEEDELVRVVVNDRVVPLESCGGDRLGMCTLGRFVESLSFARDGGHWDRCFI